jgi:hypothetical protein
MSKVSALLCVLRRVRGMRLCNFSVGIFVIRLRCVWLEFVVVL